MAIESDSSHIFWEERYRPKSVKDCVLPKRLKDVFLKCVENDTVFNMILDGEPGTGKTTLAHAICNDLNAERLFLNGSGEDRGIDTIRTKIIEFGTTVSFDGEGRKIVIFDECLAENTLVTVLRDGKIVSVPIKDVLDKTDLVRSLNVETNKIEWRPFTLFNKGEQDTIEIEFENGEVVVCTLNHKWYVIDEETGIPKIVLASELVDHVLT